MTETLKERVTPALTTLTPGGCRTVIASVPDKTAVTPAALAELATAATIWALRRFFEILDSLVMFKKLGIAREAMMAITEMTTSNSTKLNPAAGETRAVNAFTRRILPHRGGALNTVDSVFLIEKYGTKHYPK
jgi:hypothetical protein